MTTQTVTPSLDLRAFHEIVQKDLPQPPQINYGVTHDTIRIFAHAVDDHNALYLDEEYARRTVWGGVIAPPGYLASHGSSAWLASHVPEVVDADGVSLSEFVHASEEWTFLRAVRPGDFVLSHSKLAGAEAKSGAKVGASVRVGLFTRFFNQRGEDVALRTDTCFLLRKGRGGSGSSNGYPPLEHGKSRNEILPTRFPGTFQAPIPQRYRQRYFEEVSIGDEITPLQIPPVMLQHLGRFNAATIATGVDETGGPSPNGAMPDAYVFGHLRTPWFGRMLTNWGGPAAWIENLVQRDKHWLLIGFGAVCQGKVIAKSDDMTHPWIEIDLECVNELGHLTNTGRARVRLPLMDER